MKLIHCADVHLDSPLTSYSDRRKAADRNLELMNTFSRMVDYAEKEDVSAILIAGDLFDRKRVSSAVKNAVYSVMTSHPEVSFFYLRGNHDTEGLREDREGFPDNLMLFRSDWTTWTMNAPDGFSVSITGAEYNAGIPLDYQSLELDPGVVNLVMLHGQLLEHGTGQHPEEIDLRQLQNKNIDYLALGHIHSYRTGTLAPHGMYCYPGCLEGRGFDETGEHGFVLIDIDLETGGIDTEFIPFASRNVFDIPVDLSGCGTTGDILEQMKASLENSTCTPDDMVRFVLQGEADVECEKNIEYLERLFSDQYYLVRVSDESRLRVDYEQFMMDASLKGEFVRLVKDDTGLSEEEKAEMIQCGLRALNEEELFL